MPQPAPRNDPAHPPRVSVYIIAFNEAEKIRDAVSSVLWADEVIVAHASLQTEARLRSVALLAQSNARVAA